MLKDRVALWPSLFWFYIRSNRYFLRIKLAVFIVLWTALVFAGGYHYSQLHFNELVASFEALSKRYNLPYENLSWYARFSALQHQLDVADKVHDQMKQHLYEKEQIIEELEERLYFYRTVIAPEDGNADLSVFSVGLQQIEKGQTYSIEVVLRSHGINKGVMSGRVQVLVEGISVPQAKELVAKELVRGDLLDSELRFSFKYFQRLKALLQLPDGFVPQRLSVSVEAERLEDFENTYDWNGLIANKTGGL